MILTALLTLALGQACGPYTRSKTNDNNPSAPCLYWRENAQIEFRINDQGNPENVGDVEFVAVEKALASWQTELTACGSLSLSIGPRTPTRLAEFIRSAASHENVVLWRFKRCSAVVAASDPCYNDNSCGNKYDCWDHANGALALTTTSFEPQTGRILDSDIELNTPSFIFTTVDSPSCVAPNFSVNCVATDIKNAMTHELGHSLGLAHNCVDTSTMAAVSVATELNKRVLDPGSKLAMCEIYPKGKASLQCAPVDAGSTGGGAGGGGGGGGSGGSGGSGGTGGTGGVGGGMTGGSGGGQTAGSRGCGCAGVPDGLLLAGLLGLVRVFRRRTTPGAT